MPRILPLSATLFALAAACAAEDQAPTIVVTAERGESDLARTPQSVGVVTRDDLDDRGSPLETVDWFKELPGVSVVSTYGGIDGGVPAIRIRGLDSQYTEVLIDGIPLSNPTAIRGDMNFAFMSPAGVDSLELVKGPQSGLYGSRAVGGVANLLTIRPTAGAEERVRATAGSFGTVGLAAQATGPLDGKLGYAVAIEGMRSRGFTTITADPAGDPAGYDADGVERGSYDLRLEWHPRDGSEVHASAMGSRVRQDLDDIYYDASWNTDATLSANDGVARNEVSTNRLVLGGSHRSGELRFASDVAITSIAQHNQTIYGSTYVNGPIPDPTMVDYRGREVFASIQAQWKRPGFLRLSVGADGQWQNGAQDRPDLGALWSHDQRDLGVWSQATVERSWCELHAVGRHDAVSGFGGYDSGRVAGALLFDAARWKLRASVGNGFRAPTLYERYGTEYGSYPYQGNPDLKPERFIGWETGMDAHPARQVEATATYFRTRFSDRINYPTYYLPVSTQINEQGTSILQGGELGLRLAGLAGHVDVEGDYTRLHTGDSDGDPIAYNPKHRGGMRVTVKEGDVGGWAWWQSLRIDRTVGYFSYPNSAGYVAGHTLLSAVAGVKLRARWEASLRVENLLDERYTTSAATGYAYATMPRAYFVNLSGTF